MFFSSTGIVYLILSASMLVLTYRFFQYWREKQDTTSKLFFFFGLSLLALSLTRATTALFFLNDHSVLLYSIYAVAFFEGLAASVIAYLIFHLKFKKISPWIGFTVIFILSSLIIISSFKVYHQITIGDFGAINWGFPDSSFGIFYSISRMFLLLLAFIPIMIIIFQQAKESLDPIIKKRSVGLNIVLLAGILIGVIDFILVNIFEFSIFYRDIVVMFLVIILFISIIFTQRPSREYREKV